MQFLWATTSFLGLTYIVAAFLHNPVPEEIRTAQRVGVLAVVYSMWLGFRFMSRSLIERGNGDRE
jgi:hypothetical protein